jgi:hypothetical protein
MGFLNDSRKPVRVPSSGQSPAHAAADEAGAEEKPIAIFAAWKKLQLVIRLANSSASGPFWVRKCLMRYNGDNV